MNTKKTVQLIGLVLEAALFTLVSRPAQAAVITVDKKGVCTLNEAAASANCDSTDGYGCADGESDDTSGNGCTPGNGADIIVLETDVILDRSVRISSTITVEGQGYTVNGNGKSPVFSVDRGGKLILNKATVTGGSMGIAINETKVTLNNTLVTGNAGPGIGGARATITLNNSTVSNNAGTGIYTWRALITLNSSTVSGNQGSGILAHDAAASIKGSLISGNSGYEINDRADSLWRSSFNVFGHSGKKSWEAFGGMFRPSSSDVVATSDGDNPTELAAILHPLADNGGPAKTHALPSGSPAIDIDSTCSTNLTTDQRGYPRPVGAGCDAGSHERGPEQLLLEAVTALDLDTFKNKNMRNVLISKINEVIALLQQNLHQAALVKIRQDILSKTDGCAVSGIPDSNDWIMDCTSQEQVYSSALETVKYLESMK